MPRRARSVLFDLLLAAWTVVNIVPRLTRVVENVLGVSTPSDSLIGHNVDNLVWLLSHGYILSWVERVCQAYYPLGGKGACSPSGAGLGFTRKSLEITAACPQNRTQP